MQHLLENLRSHFAAPLVDGRAVAVNLRSENGVTQIRVSARRYCEGRFLATIKKLNAGYIVEAHDRDLLLCSTCSEVIQRIDELTQPYSNGCWNCGQPITLTTENRCPKCRRFIQCICGKCLCDHPDSHVRPLLSEDQIEELNRRFGLGSTTKNVN